MAKRGSCLSRTWCVSEPASGALTPSELSRLGVEDLDRWLASLLPAEQGVALVALGSYGRTDRSPYSDLDLLLLHSGATDVSALADRVWYPIWDAGLRLDHSVRTVKECLAVAGHDVRAAVGLLDARLVTGDSAPYRELVDRVRRLWEHRASSWLRELGAGVEDRRRRVGEVAFLLEPDIKEGHGGLRDLQLLRAAVLARPSLGPISTELDEAGQLLLAVRRSLHLRAGRALDQLLMQEQSGVAQDLGYPDATSLMRAVAGAGRTIAWEGDRVWHRVTRGPVRGRPVQLAPGVQLRAGELSVADPEPTVETALIAASHAARLNVPLAPPPRATSRGVPRQALVSLLEWGEAAIAPLEVLDHAGVLAQLVPEWASVRNLPQRNPYHRFTVDRHLCETAAAAATLSRQVRRPDLLLVAAWLHDIGKGAAAEDHSVAGVEIAARTAATLGFAPDEVDVVATLVRHHLTLASLATQRDVDDPATVDAVVEALPTAELIDLLEALSEADGRATGPAAWTPWKATLVHALAERARDRLAGAAPVVASALTGPLEEGVTIGPRVRVITADRPGLFADIAGALAASGLEVRAARAATVEGWAVEEFDVEPATGAWPDESRVAARVEAGVAGTLPVEGLLADRLRTYGRLRPPDPVAPVVLFSDDATDASIVEVRATDSPALLYRIAVAISALSLDIVQVRAATMGHEVVDAFYVRGLDGADRSEVARRVAAAAADPGDAC